MRRILPPLNALKAFEAAARSGGYVTAAQELAVSPAAISQQVKNLERFFDKQLFLRHNNRLTLTDAGLGVFAECSEALERLAGLSARLFEGQVRARLVVSVLPSLANRWLNHRVPQFLEIHPAIRLDIRVEEDPIDFARDDIDLRICYGRHLYPDLVNTLLIHDHVLPLCSPAFLKKGPVAPESLRDDDLIHTNWGPSFASHPTWADWFAAMGVHRAPEAGRGHRMGMSSLAIDFALSGTGIALGQRLLAEKDLAAGRLRAPFATSLALGHPYCAVHPQAKAQKPGIKPFVSWLLGDLSTAKSSQPGASS